MSGVPWSLEQVTLKPRQIAQRLGVQPSTVYRWLKSGELPFFEIGGTKYILVGAFERFVERREKGVTIEEQAARDIGEGIVLEGEVDILAGLSFPPTVTRHIAEDGSDGASALDDAALSSLDATAAARERLRADLDAYEARYGVRSEHVHREHLVEGRSRVDGVPDALTPVWARCYAAYASLALVAPGR